MKKAANIMSYIGILFIVGLVIPERNDYSVRFHCGQGIMLFIVSAVLNLVLKIVSFAMGFIPLVGWIVSSILGFAVGIAVLALMIIGIVNAATDRDVPLPVIGRFAFYR